jgi:hypothetical protein
MSIKIVSRSPRYKRKRISTGKFKPKFKLVYRSDLAKEEELIKNNIDREINLK